MADAPKDRRNITIYDIAKEAGVSPSLVSRVASGKGIVSEKSRVRVQELITKYNYRPNAVARGLQQKKTMMIGFMLPHVLTEYFSTVFFEFDKCASRHGYLTILCNGKSTSENEITIMQALVEARVDAMVIMGGGIDYIPIPAHYLEEVKRTAKILPCVFGSERIDEFDGIGVHSDDEIGTDLIIEHIKEQGFRSMAVIGGSESVYPARKKIQCLIKKGRENGILCKNEWIAGSSFSVTDGYESMKRVLMAKEYPDVVCCLNDHVALGAMNAIKDKKLSIPDDIAIIGYDGVSPSAIARPQITTVSVDYEEFGAKIFEAVNALMNHEEFPPLVLLKPNLIIRESSVRKQEKNRK